MQEIFQITRIVAKTCVLDKTFPLLLSWLYSSCWSTQACLSEQTPFLGLARGQRPALAATQKMRPLFSSRGEKGKKQRVLPALLSSDEIKQRCGELSEEIPFCYLSPNEERNSWRLRHLLGNLKFTSGPQCDLGWIMDISLVFVLWGKTEDTVSHTKGMINFCFWGGQCIPMTPVWGWIPEQSIPYPFLHRSSFVVKLSSVVLMIQSHRYGLHKIRWYEAISWRSEECIYLLQAHLS